jgi:muramoyltetrapeptide carboxypeptidase LdcA involved in peptidoglycan recycling
MNFKKISKLKPGDTVTIISPSFAAPARWPHVYQLGLERVRSVFGLNPIELSSTSDIDAPIEQKIKDICESFTQPDSKAVIASLGGDIQVTYIKKLPKELFINVTKPFFGFSDNTHLSNFLWLQGIPSYYGASLFTQFAMQKRMDDFTIKYIKHALFDTGEIKLEASEVYNDINLPWDDVSMLHAQRVYEKNDGWYWDGSLDTEGITWGGCLESIDEMLRHNIAIPTLEQFENIVLFTETSEEIPTIDYVRRVYRALGERGILSRVKAILVGRPKAWSFEKKYTAEQKSEYRMRQREKIIEVVRAYNPTVPIIQNMDFGHTDPQICIPNGQKARVLSSQKKIFIEF